VRVIAIVWHAEDAVLEMLSVIARPEHIDVIVVSRRETISLTAGEALSDRLARLVPRPVTTRSDAREWLAGVCAGAAEVWTHSPADSRSAQAEVGWLVARLCTAWHAAGQNRFLEVLPDRTVTLDRAEVTAKIDFVNRRCAEQLADTAGERAITTHAVVVVERFLLVSPAEADRMFGLTSSASDAAAVAVDPWDFATSEYEAVRLRSTAEWIGRWCKPGEHTLIEVGACEGALTRVLADAGHRVVATEPNAVFRSRLTAALSGRGVPVGQESLADLVHTTVPAPAAVLLIEMLYYGQDLALIDALPTATVFLATDPGQMTGQVKPWLARNRNWRVLDERALCAPRLEFVGGGHAFICKRGSIGVVCRRAEIGGE
jgi:hypothetical protein